MIKESVGKEIILEEEHPDVEKGIADFVTPEKHDVDTNEFTQGDVVEIHEAGSDPLKGRGYRRKRKARLLCSSYTDPTKRRKLSDINVYDPYREVDLNKVEAFCKWMKTTSSCQIIPLRFYDVQAKSLMDLSKEDSWINDSIMNKALYHIRERASRFSNLFRQDCCILDTYFYQFVVNAYGQLQSIKELKCNKSLMNYVRGATSELGKPWKDCKYLYLPSWTHDHWFAVQVDIEEWAILMFDSLKGHIRRAVLEAYFLSLQVLIPLIIKSHVTSESKYSTENFKFVNVKDVPQQVNGFDYGIFAIKFIEFLHANMDLNTIRPDYVPVWRKKLAAELLA
ncbi:ubiquitin-like-specific protease 1A [Olea europaea var. sylvestris]|uniref:ubiquitin-like-specific protease 1A n=1 Tax=Olea europaea var. sylvestris TaxID=158386 RepID=UPI000C1D6813|nr:ubiquitin-like-specific protease 1A [Olea europaea var. sylvestris]